VCRARAPGTLTPVSDDEDLRPGVLFDVDGTLLDTNYLHVLAWWQAFRDTGHDDVGMWTLHRAIGIGSEELVQRVLGHPDEETVEAHSRRYDALQDQATPFPRAADLLAGCADLGLTVVLATSGKKDDLDWMLPAIGAADGVVSASTTSDDVEAAKPHPDLLQVAVRDHGLDPARTVVVGDTVWDVHAAVLCGGIGEAELTGAGAVAVYDDPAALLDALAGSPIGSAAR
jgi:phosphoglycolate phosphatase-like HAD superfamily hydrolase